MTLAPCTWTEDEGGNWWTACGEGHVFIDGGPAENKARFCQYCGKPVEVVSYQEPSGDEQ